MKLMLKSFHGIHQIFHLALEPLKHRIAMNEEEEEKMKLKNKQNFDANEIESDTSRNWLINL